MAMDFDPSPYGGKIPLWIVSGLVFKRELQLHEQIGLLWLGVARSYP